VADRFTVRFSIFRTAVARYRKSCRWCGTRCLVGITIRHADSLGHEVIRGFCCRVCAERLGEFAASLASLEKLTEGTNA
jgi:hypothetical protein